MTMQRTIRKRHLKIEGHYWKVNGDTPKDGERVFVYDREPDNYVVLWKGEMPDTGTAGSANVIRCRMVCYRPVKPGEMDCSPKCARAYKRLNAKNARRRP